MEQVDIVGHAERGNDSFDFKIGPWVGKVGLTVRRISPQGSRETGAGRWDSVDKAKEIAETIARHQFGPDCQIVWSKFIG